MVLELSAPINLSSLRASELVPLGGEQGKMAVAFADDPQLIAFLERVRGYRSAPDAAVPYERFVDAISDVRPYGPEDRLTLRARKAVEEAAFPSALLDIHMDLWHPGDRDQAESWMTNVVNAIGRSGGSEIDRYVNHRSGLLLLRAVIPADQVDRLAHLDEVAVLDGLPQVSRGRIGTRSTSIDEIPEVTPPLASSPLMGMVDSGVRSAHPLLAGCIYDATTLVDAFVDGQDESGHGTAVAALMLHGPLDDVTEQAFLPRPPFRLLSVRVLDAANAFATNAVWESDVERAIRYCHTAGARVINLSIGDRDSPYQGSRSTPLAALIDQLVRELEIVVVVPTGNVPPVSYVSPAESEDYVARLLESGATTLLDPAPAACALTVGALAPDALGGQIRPRDAAKQRALGQGGWPAPYSRRGPGIGGAVKPEISAPGGSIATDVEMGMFVEDPALGVVSASGAYPERLLDLYVGTSFAAPLVSRIAGAVAARYPELSANLIRALTLIGSAEPRFAEAVSSYQGRDRSRAQLTTVGFGEGRLEEAVESTPHRAILIADGVIEIDTTQIFEIPIPSSFRSSGGVRGIDVALAFDPETKARRLDYAATKMEFWLVRGMTSDEISDTFTKLTDAQLAELDSDASTSISALDPIEEAEDEMSPTTVPPPTPSQLGRKLVRLEPNGQTRSRGANQLGRQIFAKKLPEEDGDTYHLVVQCKKAWGVSTSQKFGLAVALWRDDSHDPIYVELQARVEVELPVEVEIRSR